MLTFVNILLLFVYFISGFFLILFGYNCYFYLFVFLKNKKKEINKNKQFLDQFYDTFKESKLPVVTTQLPIFNEKYVARRLIDAVCDIDYPRDKHEIQVLDDSTDETIDIVKDIVDEYQKKGIDITHITRENRVDFKAGALQEGLEVAKGEYLAIFDSDFVPPKDFLKKNSAFYD